VSYSENGRPATTERKTTKYSTDPADFNDEIALDYKTSSTNERKNSRGGGVYSVTKTEKYHGDNNSNSNSKTSRSSTPSSSKVIRRGSVKELKEKFIRKDSSSKVTESSVYDSQSETESHNVNSSSSTTTKRFSKSSSSETKSFLNSEKKASNVKEVLSYMKNADHGEWRC